MDENTKEKSDWSKRELGALWRIDGQKQSYYSGEIKGSNGDKGVSLSIVANVLGNARYLPDTATILAPRLTTFTRPSNVEV